MTKRRGISPVVATVLLIAIVITIALIIFIWFKGFVKDNGEKFGQNVEIVCDRVEFDASYSTTSQKILLSNTGTVPIYNFNVQLDFQGGHNTVEMTKFSQENWPEAGLKPQSTFSSQVDIGESTKLILIPILLAESEGKYKAYQCKKDVGFTLLV